MIYEKKIKINNMINKIKDKDVLKQIFYIISKDGDSTYTYNNNGIYFDLNKMSDNILIQLENLLTNNDNDTETVKYTINSHEENEYVKINK